MRTFVYFFLILAVCTCSFGLNTQNRKKKKKKEKCVQAAIYVTQTSSYCGGIAPTDEMIKNLMSPSLFPNKKIFVKKGETNRMADTVLLQLQSDEKGNVTFHLPPGKYCIVDERKSDSSYYKTLLKNFSKSTKEQSAVDSRCLRDWISKPDAVIEIVSPETGKNRFTINYHHNCPWNITPCSQYSGPLPP